MLLIRPGEFGPRVALLQILLNRGGAAIKVDGYFGKLTAAAVLDFKRRAGIGAHGATIDPVCWWKLPLGKNTQVIDVVDVGDPEMGGDAVRELQKAGGDPIQFGLMCAGVEQMVSEVTRRCNGPRSVALLRITGHGNLGRWMTVSVGDIVDSTRQEQKVRASEDHSYVAYENFAKLSAVLSRLAGCFAPYGGMEHGGCSLGGKPHTRLLMGSLADLWQVPVSAGIGVQQSILNFDGAIHTAYPNHGSLAKWSEPYGAATF